MVRARSGRWLAACVVFALVTLAGAAVAATVYGGWILAGVLLGVAAAVVAIPRGRRRVWGTAVVATLLLIAACLLLPMISTANEAMRRSQCVSNLRLIGLALHSYYDLYGSLPPASVTDETGRPMHSWRVLVLPWLEATPLYRRYDFSEPWDGPNNRLLSDAIPPIYRCPNQPSSEPAEEYTTSYAALVGPSTVWAKGNGDLDALEAPDSTLLVVETVEAQIHWMEPRDIPLEEFTALPPPEPSWWEVIFWGFPPHPPPHPGGRNHLFADGSVRFISFPLTPDSLATLASVEADPKLYVEPLYPQLQEPSALERYLPAIRLAGLLVTLLGAIGFGIALARIRDRR